MDRRTRRQFVVQKKTNYQTLADYLIKKGYILRDPVPDGDGFIYNVSEPKSYNWAKRSSDKYFIDGEKINKVWTRDRRYSN